MLFFLLLLFSHVFGWVVVALPSLRSFWVVLFSLLSLGLLIFVRLPCGWWSFLLLKDNLVVQTN